MDFSEGKVVTFRELCAMEQKQTVHPLADEAVFVRTKNPSSMEVRLAVERALLEISSPAKRLQRYQSLVAETKRSWAEAGDWSERDVQVLKADLRESLVAREKYAPIKTYPFTFDANLYVRQPADLVLQTALDPVLRELAKRGPDVSVVATSNLVAGSDILSVDWTKGLRDFSAAMDLLRPALPLIDHPNIVVHSTTPDYPVGPAASAVVLASDDSRGLRVICWVFDARGVQIGSTHLQPSEVGQGWPDSRTKSSHPDIQLARQIYAMRDPRSRGFARTPIGYFRGLRSDPKPWSTVTALARQVRRFHPVRVSVGLQASEILGDDSNVVAFLNHEPTPDYGYVVGYVPKSEAERLARAGYDRIESRGWNFILPKRFGDYARSLPAQESLIRETDKSKGLLKLEAWSRYWRANPKGSPRTWETAWLRQFNPLLDYPTGRSWQGNIIPGSTRVLGDSLAEMRRKALVSSMAELGSPPVSDSLEDKVLPVPSTSFNVFEEVTETRVPGFVAEDSQGFPYFIEAKELGLRFEARRLKLGEGMFERVEWRTLRYASLRARSLKTRVEPLNRFISNPEIKWTEAEAVSTPLELVDHFPRSLPQEALADFRAGVQAAREPLVDRASGKLEVPKITAKCVRTEACLFISEGKKTHESSAERNEPQTCLARALGRAPRDFPRFGSCSR